MPELPEVEVVRRSLVRHLPGRRFERVALHRPALREPLDHRALCSLAGRRVRGLRRRAKYLLIDLSGDSTLVVHLGMSGRFTVVPPTLPRAKHEHLAFYLEGGERLRFVDPRRFGVVFVGPTAEIMEDRHLAHLGVEPLDDTFTHLFMLQQAKGRRIPIKSFLMDGRIVVGVGNIYACESLWQACVHPKRSVARVSAASWARVVEAVGRVLALAIEEGGTTLNDFTDGEGNSGYFQISLAVYGREGEACPRCERTIKRFVQGGRSTFYCPGCQH